MSVEVARRFAEALDAEDWETARALLDPEVEIVRPSGRRFRGADSWIAMNAEANGYANITSDVVGRKYEERDGVVVETMHVVHRWHHSGEIAYTSDETTEVSFRGGRIVRLVSTVEHRAAA